MTPLGLEAWFGKHKSYEGSGVPREWWGPCSPSLQLSVALEAAAQLPPEGHEKEGKGRQGAQEVEPASWEAVRAAGTAASWMGR